MKAKNRSIYLEPHGGIANRMRVIASGLKLAKEFNVNIIVIWNLNKALNCDFHDLFEPLQNVSVIKKRLRYYFFRSTEMKSFPRKVIINILNRIIYRDFIVFEDPDIAKIRKGEINMGELINSHNKLYFRTCGEFGNINQEIRMFSPIKPILQKINKTSQKFNSKTIGIHIRRTDHVIAIQQSPTQLFINKIEDIIKSDDDINIYLSTDDPETEDQIKNKYGNRIITLHKDFSRNSKQGIQDGVVDMYCLSRTSKIYGSYWSSFSEMAARISNIKLERIRINQ